MYRIVRELENFSANARPKPFVMYRIVRELENFSAKGVALEAQVAGVCSRGVALEASVAACLVGPSECSGVGPLVTFTSGVSNADLRGPGWPTLLVSASHSSR
jgi:hypothetical protein